MKVSELLSEMAGASKGRPCGEGGGRAICGNVVYLVLVQHPAQPSLGPRLHRTAPWVTAMTSTIEGAGTSLEESAATMIVLGKEMKGGEGMIGMTGNFVLFDSVLFYSHCFLRYCFIRMNCSEKPSWIVFCGSAYLLLVRELDVA